MHEDEQVIVLYKNVPLSGDPEKDELMLAKQAVEHGFTYITTHNNRAILERRIPGDHHTGVAVV